MSLGARELMHTNFLAYLLETDNIELEALRIKLRAALGFSVAAGEASTCAVWREAKNLDLILVPLQENSAGQKASLNRTRAHVVEAKLKSIPTLQQLTRYEKVISDGFTLYEQDSTTTGRTVIHIGGKVRKDGLTIKDVSTSLLTPNGTSLSERWQPCRWADVVSAIKTGLSSDTPHAALLLDYAESLSSVAVVAGQAETFMRNAWEEKETTTYCSVYQSPRSDALSHARLTDLTSKIIYDTWLQYECSALRPLPDGKLYHSEVFYLHSLPGISIAFTSQRPFKGQWIKVGVQIQDTEFRHFVALDKDDADFEHYISSKKEFFGDWLHAPVFGTVLEGKRLPDPGRSANLRAFNRKRFLFTKSRIEIPMTFAEVSAQLHESLALARQMFA
jgi:hypothetical protein